MIHLIKGLPFATAGDRQLPPLMDHTPAQRWGRNTPNHPCTNHQRLKNQSTDVKASPNTRFPEPSHMFQGLNPPPDSFMISYLAASRKPRRKKDMHSFYRGPPQCFPPPPFFFPPPLQRENKFNRRQMHFMVFNNFLLWFNHSVLRTSIKSVFKTNNST